MSPSSALLFFSPEPVPQLCRNRRRAPRLVQQSADWESGEGAWCLRLDFVGTSNPRFRDVKDLAISLSPCAPQELYGGLWRLSISGPARSSGCPAAKPPGGGCRGVFQNQPPLRVCRTQRPPRPSSAQILRGAPTAQVLLFGDHRTPTSTGVFLHCVQSQRATSGTWHDWRTDSTGIVSIRLVIYP